MVRQPSEVKKPLNYRDLSPSNRPDGATVSTDAVSALLTHTRERSNRSRGPSTALVCRLLAALAGLLAAPSAAAVRSFEVSQTALLEGNLTALRSYARVLDERNEPIFHLERASISATLGARDLDLVGVQAFHQSGEGVAYIFLVDISRSLSEHEFALIQESLENWMTALRPQDRAAILAFGDKSRLNYNYTVFGQVIAGMETVLAIQPGDVMERVEIARVGSEAAAFRATRALFDALREKIPPIPDPCGRR